MEEQPTTAEGSRTSKSPILDHEIPETGAGLGGGPATRTSRYEEESSDRVSKGSVTVPPDTWWSAELAVSMTGNQSALLIIERHGANRALGPNDAALAIPPGEADAVITLLTGIVDQARRDGVLLDGVTDQATTATQGIKPVGA